MCRERLQFLPCNGSNNLRCVTDQITCELQNSSATFVSMGSRVSRDGDDDATVPTYNPGYANAFGTEGEASASANNYGPRLALPGRIPNYRDS